jgi:DNA-binding response OmpR family regulator
LAPGAASALKPISDSLHEALTSSGLADPKVTSTRGTQHLIDGHRIALTKLEFEILNYLHQRPGKAVDRSALLRDVWCYDYAGLCERPGKVVERSALLRDVWGYDYAGGSNVIEVVITSTRRKLGSRAGAIETVRGLGYRFVASA